MFAVLPSSSSVKVHISLAAPTLKKGSGETIDIRLLRGIGNGVTRPAYYLYN